MFLRSEAEKANNSNQKKKNSAVTRNGLRDSRLVVNMAGGEGGRKGRSSYNAIGHSANGVETTSDRMSRKQMKSDRQQLTKQEQQNGTLSTTTTTATACNSGVPPDAATGSGAGSGADAATAAERTKLPNGGDCGADKSESDLVGVVRNEIDERKSNEVILPMTQESNARSSSPSSYSYSGDGGNSDVVQGETVENVVHVMEKISLGTATAPAPAPIPAACLSSIPRAAQLTQRKMDSIGSEGSHHLNLSPAFKFLIPSAVAGCIIGKGGRIICKVQQETGTKIKLSQNYEFFPGTNDRVCLIIGNEENILVAMTDILQRIVGVYHHLEAYLAKRQQHPSRENGVGGTEGSNSERAPGHPVQTDVAGATRSAQDDSVLQENEENVETVYIKVLVPMAAANHLLKENNGTLNEALTLTSATCIFTIMEDNTVPHERVCALSGTVKEVLGLVQALFLVLRKKDLGGGYIHMSTAYRQCRSAIPSGGGAAVLRKGGGGEQSSSTDPYYPNPSRKQQQQSRIQYPYGGGGGEGLPIDSGQDLGATDRRGAPAAACAQQGQQAAHIGSLYSGCYPVTSQEWGPSYGVTPGGSNLIGTTSQEPPFYFPYYMGGIRDPSMIGMNGVVYPEGPPMTAAPQAIQVQVTIPDFLVGLVLGKRGANIMRIQKATGARVHISPRGRFVPGTTHRAVAITGTLQETTAAQYLINQCLNSAMGDVHNSEINVPQQKVPPYTQQLLYSSQYDQAVMYPQQQRGHFVVPPPQVETFFKSLSHFALRLYCKL